MICEYGCGQEAKYKLIGRNKKEKWCCSPSKNSCLEQRRLNSEANSGENHHNYGKKNPEETKKKISNTKKNQWKNPTWDEEERRRKQSAGHKGKNNPAWQGGISRLPYAEDWGPKVKKKVFERDRNECQNCGDIENLVPHHIDYDKMNCDSTNLITLCVSCNGRANGNRNYWQKIYESKLLKKQL